MGQRCTQARFLEGKPAKLRRTNKGVLCERCVQEGYTLEDAPTFHSESGSDRQAASQFPECAICRKPAVACYGDTYFCEEHREQLHEERNITVFSPADEPSQPPEEVFDELFRAARVLFADHVTEEERIIPTLAFANRASDLPELRALKEEFAKTAGHRKLREQFSNDFCRRFRGLIPISVTDGVLVLSRVPVFLDVFRYTDTAVIKEIKIDVFMRSVKPGEVAELYRQRLAREGVPYEKSNEGSFSWAFSDAYLSMVVGPGKELNPGQAVRFSSRGAQVDFPPPQLIGELYADLKGSVNARRFRGFAYALGGRQSGTAALPDNLIPACVGWYLREPGGITDKHRLVSLLNRHLLIPCGKTVVDVTSDHAVWRNIDKVADSIMRVELALQKGWQPPWTRVSETRA
jgi:hypothetical protein